MGGLLDKATVQLIAELVAQVEDLKQRVAALEEKEFAVMQSGNGAPAHEAAQSVFYWDWGNKCLYVNTNGSDTWLECCCVPE